MTPSEQQPILRVLLARGWIDEAEIPPFEEGDDGSFDRVDLLVRRGLVDGSVVRAIADELRASSPPRQAISGAESPPATLDAPAPSERVAPARGEEPVAADPLPEQVPPELARWERYTVERPLGRGASGIVYVAHDGRLDRRVAIKVLSGGGERALQEARRQARVAHEGVCEVYEVGWVADRPFVAMQLVHGETLHRAAGSLTREQIVIAVRDAARAAHAAHRIGLVHRDLKPGNIMIERPDDGAQRTFVVDFGLAKEIGGDSSVTGNLLGTPAFMAPEQARGEVRRIDRRTDVYGLGATLYAALSGAPPFRGPVVAVLRAVLEEEPAPLRSHDASIPRDLETIAATCMEKDPERRYPTAAALADDLERYLAGEPIVARRLDVVARLGRWIRRHRAIAATSAAGVLAAGVLAGGWARSFVVGREDAAIARRLGEEGRSMESVLRFAYLSPLHDTAPERAAIEARLPAIEREAKGRGETVRAAAAYAAGRGLLSLHRHEEARERLERAWKEGDRSAPLALALARALGEIHQARLAEARKIVDPEARTIRIQELSEELVKPALAYLAGARVGDSESPALVLGWIALHEGRYDDALHRAREALAGAPWLYEARKLEGDAQARRADSVQDAGDLEGALAIYALAAEAYEQAGEIARSDASVHAAACRSYLRMASLQTDHLNVSLDVAMFERGLAACDRAMAADSADPDPIEDEAHLLAIRGADALAMGSDPRAWLDAAITLAEDVTLVFPDRAEAHATLGVALWTRSTYELRTGEDSRPSLLRGIDACERAAELSPEHTQVHNYLGVMNMGLAEDTAKRGGDPRAPVLRAIEHYGVAARLDPSFVGVWNNIGRARALAAEHEMTHGLPARASLDETHSAYANALAVLGDHPSLLNNIGYAWQLEARHAITSGADPGPALRNAIGVFDRVHSLSPTQAFAWKNAGDTHRIAAEVELAAGRDPSAELERAALSFAEALRVNPRYAGALRGAARGWLVAARARKARGDSAERELGEARAALDRAASLAPSDTDLVAVRAELEAVATSAKGAPPAAAP